MTRPASIIASVFLSERPDAPFSVTPEGRSVTIDTTRNANAMSRATLYVTDPEVARAYAAAFTKAADMLAAAAPQEDPTND